MEKTELLWVAMFFTVQPEVPFVSKEGFLIRLVLSVGVVVVVSSCADRREGVLMASVMAKLMIDLNSFIRWFLY